MKRWMLIACVGIVLAPVVRADEVADSVETKTDAEAIAAVSREKDKDVVLRAASSASGRSVDEIRAALEGDEDGASVLADRDEARAIGVQAVPTFLAQGRLAVQGAQPPEVLTALLDQARAGA